MRNIDPLAAGSSRPSEELGSTAIDTTLSERLCRNCARVLDKYGDAYQSVAPLVLGKGGKTQVPTRQKRRSSFSELVGNMKRSGSCEYYKLFAANPLAGRKAGQTWQPKQSEDLDIQNSVLPRGSCVAPTHTQGSPRVSVRFSERFGLVGSRNPGCLVPPQTCYRTSHQSVTVTARKSCGSVLPAFTKMNV